MTNLKRVLVEFAQKMYLATLAGGILEKTPESRGSIRPAMGSVGWNMLYIWHTEGFGR